MPKLDISAYNFAEGGAPYRWGDYEVGERIDHVDGMTLEEAEHQMATRLYQNTAKVHFNQHTEIKGRFGKRIVYGGVTISLARALSFNGLNNAFHIAAINGGRHVAPLFAGDTVYSWSEVLEKAELPGRSDVGALRTRLVAVKNQDCAALAVQESDRRIRRRRDPRSRRLAGVAEVAAAFSVAVAGFRIRAKNEFIGRWSRSLARAYPHHAHAAHAVS